MSMYSEFYKEVAGWDTIETDEFFVTYMLNDFKGIKSLKIINAFVKKDFRSKGKAYEIIDMMEDLAKKEGCQILSAVVAKDSSEFTQQRTTHILRTKGMELMYEDIFNIVYGRRI